MLQKLAELRPAIEAQANYIKKTMRDFRDLLTAGAAGKEYFYDGYPFDVRPATDDAPFFFNFYKWSGLLRGGRSAGADGAFNYHSDFPIGHFVLGVSMLQILALAALLIFLPLRKLRASGVRTPGTGRIFLYFAARNTDG